MTLFDLAWSASGALDTIHRRVPEAALPEWLLHCGTGDRPADRGADDQALHGSGLFGVTINPPMLEGRVPGGTVQGVGQALDEGVIHDEKSRQPLTESFQDCRMPGAKDFPHLSITLRAVPCLTSRRK